jgi:NTP pyrophosphatase (non-canonical NTP hydrolase)
MSESDYEKFVNSRIKKGGSILQSLTPISANIWHMGTGICTEAGELMSSIKKYTVYEKPLDRENLIEELGDLEFYLAGLRTALGLNREEILKNNEKKLTTRYPIGYTNKAAITRADKQEEKNDC